MKDAVLRDYFENLISTDILYMDVEGSEVKTSYDVISVYIDQIKDGSEYIVTKDHLLKLCNDALSGNLKMSHLTTIAFALEFSDYFTWDSDEDDIVATVVFDWDNPEINFQITLDNLKLWKIYLETGIYKLKA
ncbi:MAG TPA: hypothetical protein VK671_09975 [Mucilaginibacter sp.]|nr:hypothetical protein [Mucilaginibacter sp.]